VIPITGGIFFIDICIMQIKISLVHFSQLKILPRNSG
jgi:hypothetical protein